MKKTIITILLSLIVGVFSCFFYNVEFRKIQYGLLLSLLLIAFIALFIKINYGNRKLIIYSIVIFFVIFFFSSLGRFGDDIIIMGNTTGLIFVIGGVFISPLILLIKKIN